MQRRGLQRWYRVAVSEQGGLLVEIVGTDRRAQQSDDDEGLWMGLHRAEDERVVKTVGTNQTAYVYGEGRQLIGEYTTNSPQEYIYLDGVPVAVEANGQLYYVETD